MAKTECAICKKEIGFFESKVPFADGRVICTNCSKTVECTVCKKKFGFFDTRVLIADGLLCTGCLKKAGITSLSNPQSYTCESVKELIDRRISIVQSFKATKKIGGYLLIDEQNEAFQIGKDIFEYNNLLSFELLEDDQTITKGGLGRAVVGGMLFGGVGAIVGASTGGKKSKGICNSMKLRVTLRNSHLDNTYITFIASETKTKGFIYKAAQESAQSCISALEIIADHNDTRKEAANVPVVNMNVSAADEILKFKQLLDAGIITQEEFEAKKKQILNL